MIDFGELNFIEKYNGEKAENLDENLISILLDNDTTREKFFIKIKDVIKHIIKYKIQNPIYYPIY
ncbi:hypothetical protein BLD25_04275 [Candidatus Gracilibacteria bacterium GN02-872]|nr:hypothetical protein BLD25_04275 [Candidatus Gracilibacteria bacterium GN02-872]